MSAMDLVEIVGECHMETLTAYARGRRLYIPETIPAGHPIRLLIGCGAAERLCEVYGGDVIEFGTGRPRSAPHPDTQSIRRDRAGGATVEELAERYQRSTRQIYRILAA